MAYGRPLGIGGRPAIDVWLADGYEVGGTDGMRPVAVLRSGTVRGPAEYGE